MQVHRAARSANGHDRAEWKAKLSAQHITNFQIVDPQRLVDEKARGDSSVPASTLHVGLVGELGNASAMTDSPAEGNQEARNDGKPESNGG